MTTDTDKGSTGEGDYESAKRYTDEKTEFVESGKADEAAESLTGQPDPEDQAAHDRAADRAKEHDPRETENFDQAS